MRRILFSVSLQLMAMAGFCQQTAIVPRPMDVKAGEGRFVLNAATVLVVRNAVDNDAASFFTNYLSSYFSLTLKRARAASSNFIEFTTAQTLVPGKEGAYAMTVNPKGVTVIGQTASGTFYGMQTLLQLLPVEKKSPPYPISSVEISDAPRFSYRGMHLDVSRHFFPVSFLKKYIDFLALHKLNTFHWHLTEDQGWRIEIKKYPRLTSVGGWRNGTIIGRYPGTGSDNRKYGGFYTQAQIREVVAYAKRRFIDVIPEIEMPGHGGAAIAAYEWLSCFPNQPTVIPPNMISPTSVNQQARGRIKLVQETWGVFDDVFCAGNDSTFLFLQNVIDEVITLFPSKYFHVGGDECPKTHWKKCPRCQQRMKDHGLKDEHELQSYFIQRIEKYLNSKGKTLIGWDEILEGGLAPKAVVMSWRGEEGGIAAAKQNHDVIMTPGNPVYFDHTQSLNEDSVTIGGYNPLEKVYAYEPVPKELSSEESIHILGAQANLWTEYIKNSKKVEYMIFPRMAALSEILWSSKASRNWAEFETNLRTQFKRYDLWKVNYSKAYFDVSTIVVPAPDQHGVIWRVSKKSNEGALKIGDEISFDTYDSNSYDYRITNSSTSGQYQAAWINITKRIPGKKADRSGIEYRYLSKPVSQQFHFNKATGKRITLTNEPSRNYPGDGAFTLVNGVQNSKGLGRSREFLGWTGDDLEAIIDLGSSESISESIVHSLSSGGSWIYPPRYAEVFTSSDGQKFISVGRNELFEKNTNGSNGTIKVSFAPVTTRYVKIIVKNLGTIPDDRPGAGNKPWLFVDEIEIN
ncbi:MAG: family 20 glycosylhydrolase [Chitinophagaceae bacterium]|nr:family 20 glycosylhydrolase [Chitinophagaceae bacterium]